MKIKFNLIVALGFIVYITSIFSCSENNSTVYLFEASPPKLPETPYEYKNQQLKNAELAQMLASRINDHTATLGRVLFYDKILSKNNKVSCASCHIQSKGFADNKPLSEGFNGKLTRRNSMSICNTIASNSFFWDTRETKLENLVLQPVSDHIEMGMEKLDVLGLKLENAGYYENLFKNAYGDKSITKERIATALAQFVNSMVSDNARASEVQGNSWTAEVKIPESFSAEETQGAILFFGKAKCGNCHIQNANNLILSFLNSSADIGLDLEPKDLGIGEINPKKAGEFKIPNLSNIALTAPYMHDGRFNTLEEVLDHYSENIKASQNLSWELKDSEGKPLKMKFTLEEKKSLIAFLHTFTDETMIKDAKFSDPF